MFMRVAAWASLRVAGFPRGDLVLAAALGAVAVASVLTGNPDEGPVALTLPVAVVTCAAVAWRTRAPVISVASSLRPGRCRALAAAAPGSLWSLVVYVIVMYSVAAHSREGMAAIAGVGFVAALFCRRGSTTARIICSSCCCSAAPGCSAGRAGCGAVASRTPSSTSATWPGSPSPKNACGSPASCTTASHTVSV